MCEKSFFFLKKNILENLENRHARMSYWTNTQEKKGKKFLLPHFYVSLFGMKKAQNEKKKVFEGTVVIMETAGFSSFFSLFILGERLRKMSRNKSCFAMYIR